MEGGEELSLLAVRDPEMVERSSELSLDLVEGKAKISGKVQAGYVYVDGLSVGDVGEPARRAR